MDCFIHWGSRLGQSALACLGDSSNWLPKRQMEIIIIWDCDPRSPYTTPGDRHKMKRLKRFVLGTQIKLWNFQCQQKNVGKCRTQINGLFYNTDMSLSDQDRCLEHTLHWVTKMANHTDKPFAGLDGNGNSLDPRTSGCVS